MKYIYIWYYLDVIFSFSSDYGYIWQSIDHDQVLFFEDNQTRKPKIFTWKFSSNILG